MHSPGGSNPYPKDAVAVTTNPAYKVGVFSGLTGISYSVRPLGQEEVATMPMEYVFSDEETSVPVVPIKDGKIVEFVRPDRAGAFFPRHLTRY